jgi:hypothetical protein
MMRRLTILTMLMAAGSGLYLYQAKHRAQMESQRIARLLAETDAVRQRIGLMVTDYQLENDPERLRDLTTKFLPTLHGTQPPQFTSMAELDKRLPPIGSPSAAATTPLEADEPAADVPAKTPDPAATPVAQAGKADRTLVADSMPRPAVVRTPSPAAAHPASGERVIAAAAPRPAPAPRPRVDHASLETPVAAPVFAMSPASFRAPTPNTATPQTGSMLGMARQSNAPAVTYSAFQPGTGG